MSYEPYASAHSAGAKGGTLGGQNGTSNARTRLLHAVCEWLPPQVSATALLHSHPELLEELVKLQQSPQGVCNRIEGLMFGRAGLRPLSLEALNELASIRNYVQSQIQGYRASVWDELHRLY